jgi:ATP-dependent Lon protease
VVSSSSTSTSSSTRRSRPRSSPPSPASTTPGRLADTIAAHLPLKLEQKQAVLDLSDVGKRLEKLLTQLEHEIDILQVEKRIRGRVKRQMEKSQREYYLNEQVKAIQKELGEGEEGADSRSWTRSASRPRACPRRRARRPRASSRSSS